jgi:hypothetical protein
VTLLAMPRKPVAWHEAVQQGQWARQETRFALFASQTIRAMRERRQEPVAVLGGAFTAMHPAMDGLMWGVEGMLRTFRRVQDVVSPTGIEPVFRA